MTATMLAADLARILKDTAIFACTDSTLPMIHAVRFESTAEHLVAVATDRFTMAAAVADWHEDSDEPLKHSGEVFELSLSLPHARLVAKVATSVKAMFTTVAVSHTDEVVTFAFAGGETLVLPKVTGTTEFPDWRRLVTGNATDAETPGTRNFGVNPQYLARFGRVTDSQRMVMKFGAPTKPALVTVGSQFFGLIMPLRIDEKELEETGAPSWAMKPAEQVKPAEPPKKRAPRKPARRAPKSTGQVSVA